MAQRMVVVGGDAAGMSAASQAKRLGGDRLDVVAFERGTHTSYSACGIPYWVAGDVDDEARLVARTPEQHRANGIDLRMQECVEAVDLDRGEVSVRRLADGSTYSVGYDHLVLATGARPVRPPLAGVDAPGVYGVQTLADGEAILAAVRGNGDRPVPRRAVVVGAGYIGVEMAEAMLRRGLEVTVVDLLPEPMSTVDADMGRLVREAMECVGMRVLMGTPVDGFETDASGHVCAVATADATLEADIVVLGMGVRPETQLAVDAGLPVGPTTGLRTDVRMRVRGHDNVWAAGDCVESFDRLSQTYVHVPLGTHANKQGRVVGTNVGGGYATFPGIVRTAVSKVCDLEIARTGLTERDAHAVGSEVIAVTVESTTRAGYFPGAEPLTVKMLVEPRTGRLLGAQIVGREGAAKRIDVCAVALWNGMTVEDIMSLDLAYAPPYSPVWDPVLIAARKAADAVAQDRYGGQRGS
ncbi:MAG: FAD-dependent oxidoreductase [Actinomycetota bacterium]|nr:FAD-dependent oxidoreductase [Actinomycetota bacterium]